ncbi:NADPH-dependent 7-cyano-7-deazaguanine reductase QueF [Chromatocurvus halotolerans]|uniref:7-cyano-7-deazaguanine reductase n=1 Tax=Chromatocurvus halotolerans TaxID=1132028 RepID=A0A4R2KY61_9GAMM|nr:NADPH-dependent 7-cyano-7-deazaguanine reductase QueF [Chromatocurvus halotolerans]TCO77837.1 7-cyano-7-deazaguanine reductase [Chromatocurvus halotolerans]
MSGTPEARGELLLGRQVEYTDVYTPQLLQPIPRQQGRAALGLESGALSFYGEDVWHAYELSWLDPGGRPRVAAARLVIPAFSPNLVESKSLKLYLNSVNNTVFRDETALQRTLADDISAAVGAAVELELLSCDDPNLAGIQAPGECIDGAAFSAPEGEPSASLLLRSTPESIVTQVLHSHLLRSLCPVTAQPDWATLVVKYTGPLLDPASLLQYVVAFRRHQEFHEQCVERIFCDIRAALSPEALSVHALYTRRGGLDICPWRSTEGGAAPRFRLNRQ